MPHPRSPSPKLAPLAHRNGLKWRDGRPRWEPSPTHRAMGLKGLDLKTGAGAWMNRGEALAAADARKLWADLVREAAKEDAVGGEARADLRQALEALPIPADAAARHQRTLVADVIERGRAILAGRDAEEGLKRGGAPRSVGALVDAFAADPTSTRKPATRRAYLGQDGTGGQAKRIRAQFGHLHIDAVTRGMVRAWYVELLDQTSPAVANLAVGALGRFYKWGELHDWTDRPSPVQRLDKVRSKGRRVFWTVEEELGFIPFCDANGFSDVADGVTAGLWTGARIGDICRADLEKMRKGAWRFVPEKTDHTGREALPGIMPKLRERIERREGQRLTSNRRLFLLNPKGAEHTQQTFYNRFKAAKAAALKAEAVPLGFAVKTVQDTRDTCITRLAAADVPFMKIWPWTGHSPKDVEEILREHYISLLEEGAMETVRIFSTWAEKNGLALSA